MTVWATELTNILSIMTSLEQKITSRGNKLENVTHMQEKKKYINTNWLQVGQDIK